MNPDVDAILRLEVPIIVQIGDTMMPVERVLALVPGSIIELPKAFDEELELLVNNKPLATGIAIKIGENFGLKVSYVGNLKERLEALASDGAESAVSEAADAAAEDLADSILAGL